MISFGALTLRTASLQCKKQRFNARTFLSYLVWAAVVRWLAPFFFPSSSTPPLLLPSSSLLPLCAFAAFPYASSRGWHMALLRWHVAGGASPLPPTLLSLAPRVQYVYIYICVCLVFLGMCSTLHDIVSAQCLAGLANGSVQIANGSVRIANRSVFIAT
jgi:hypothetical protein